MSAHGTLVVIKSSISYTINLFKRTAILTICNRLESRILCNSINEVRIRVHIHKNKKRSRQRIRIGCWSEYGVQILSFNLHGFSKYGRNKNVIICDAVVGVTCWRFITPALHARLVLKTESDIRRTIALITSWTKSILDFDVTVSRRMFCYFWVKVPRPKAAANLQFYILTFLRRANDKSVDEWQENYYSRTSLEY